MPRPRGTSKVRICISIRPQARAILEELASQHRRPMSEVVEDLLIQADEGREDYFRRQCAFQSFVGAAMSIAAASKLLGPQATGELQDRAEATARRLYGRSPVRAFEVGDGRADEDDDVRVRALLLAFGAE